MQPINPINHVNFKSQNNKKPEKSTQQETKSLNQGEKLGLALMGLATIAAAAVGVKKCSTTSFEKALAKNGVELKKGVAYVKETGQKFTGSIERNSKAFQREKEVTKYVDGIISEKLLYGSKGQELSGKFYKDGKLFREACLGKGPTGNDMVVYYQYGKRGITEGSGTLPGDKPFFEKMRGELKCKYSGFVIFD